MLSWAKMSLQQRITLSVALGLGLILTLFGAAALWAVQQSTEAVLRERLLLAQAMAGQVDNRIGFALDQLEKMARPVERDNIEAQRKALADAYSQQDLLAGLAWLDDSGVVVWSEPAHLGGIGAPWQLYPSVALALRGGPPAAFELSPRAAGAKGVIALTTPVRGMGRARGALVAVLDLQPAGHPFLPTLPASGHVHTEIMDAAGTIGASFPPEEESARLGHGDLLAPLITGRRAGATVHRVPAPFKDHIVAYAPLASLAGWGITVEQDEDVALALPHSLRWGLLAFGILALVAAALFAWVDVRRVVQPLGVLTAAAERIAAGDLESPIAIGRRDEVGLLASAFDAMRVKLRASLDEIGRWNQDLEARVNKRTQELSALFEASQALTSTLILTSVSDTCAQMTAQIAAVLGAQECLIALCGEGGQVVGQAPGYGIDSQAILGFLYQAPGPAAPGIVEGLEPPVACAGEADPSHGQRFREAFGAQNVVTVPLVVQGQTIGIIYAADKPGGFSADDTRLLSILASQVAVAVENARLYEELRRKEELRRQLLDKVISAQEEERKRVARELHDDVGQALTALVMNLGSIEGALPKRLGELRERLAETRNLTSEALHEIRRLMLDLRPTLLDDLGLIPAISWYTETHLARARVEGQLEVVGFRGRDRLPPQLETVLFRVVQEAISNIVRHAGARKTKIRLELKDSEVQALIEDDGAGFDMERVRRGREGGLGLVGMEERVTLAGGTFRLESRPGGGTRLSLTLPLGPGEGQP